MPAELGFGADDCHALVSWILLLRTAITSLHWRETILTLNMNMNLSIAGAGAGGPARKRKKEKHSRMRMRGAWDRNIKGVNFPVIILPIQQAH
jgi:hypothetical protein